MIVFRVTAIEILLVTGADKAKIFLKTLEVYLERNNKGWTANRDVRIKHTVSCVKADFKTR